MSSASRNLEFLRTMEDWVLKLPEGEQTIFNCQVQLMWATMMHGPTSQKVAKELIEMKNTIASCRAVNQARDPLKTLREVLFNMADGLGACLHRIRNPALRRQGPPEALTNLDGKVNEIRATSANVANVLLAQIDLLFLFAEQGISEHLTRDAILFRTTVLEEHAAHKQLRGEHSMERMVFRMAKCVWMMLTWLIKGKTVGPNEECGCCPPEPRVNGQENIPEDGTTASEEEDRVVVQPSGNSQRQVDSDKADSVDQRERRGESTGNSTGLVDLMDEDGPERGETMEDASALDKATAEYEEAKKETKEAIAHAQDVANRHERRNESLGDLAQSAQSKAWTLRNKAMILEKKASKVFEDEEQKKKSDEAKKKAEEGTIRAEDAINKFSDVLKSTVLEEESIAELRSLAQLDEDDSDVEVAVRIIKPVNENANGQENEEEEDEEEEDDEEVDKLFACVFCGECLTSSKWLEHHVKRIHKVNRKVKMEDPEFDDDGSPNKKRKVDQPARGSSENELSTNDYLVHFAEKYGKSLEDILAINDDLWNALPQLESHLSRKEVRECKALAGDSVDKLSLAYLVCYLNKSSQPKNNDLKTRLQRIFMTADSESAARIQLKRRKIYLVALTYANDRNSHYLFVEGAIKPVEDGGLRQIILAMMAAIDLYNIRFDSLTEDIASFFYLSAGCSLPSVDEGVKKAIEIIKG